MEVKDIETIEDLKKYLIFDLMLPNIQTVLSIVDLAYSFGKTEGGLETANSMRDVLLNKGAFIHEQKLKELLDARKRNN